MNCCKESLYWSCGWAGYIGDHLCDFSIAPNNSGWISLFSTICVNGYCIRIGVKLPGRKVELFSRNPIELNSCSNREGFESSLGPSIKSFLLIVITVSAAGGYKSTTSLSPSSADSCELGGVGFFAGFVILFGATFLTFCIKGFTTVLAFFTLFTVGWELPFFFPHFLADWERKILSDYWLKAWSCSYEKNPRLSWVSVYFRMSSGCSSRREVSVRHFCCFEVVSRTRYMKSRLISQ